jgi:hypothetical protein
VNDSALRWHGPFKSPIARDHPLECLVAGSFCPFPIRYAAPTTNPASIALTYFRQSRAIRVLEIPDPHLYFQAPRRGQCIRPVGSDEDLSFYEGVDEGSDLTKMKKAIA